MTDRKTSARITSQMSIEQILPDVRRGQMVILVDSEDRENEGDLFVAAERATPEAINFMASQGRGLISRARIDLAGADRRSFAATGPVTDHR